MLVDRARMFLLSLPLLILMLLAGCSGGGGDPGAVSAPPPPPGATTGSLQVVINSLPAGTNATVRVTGPNNFAQRERQRGRRAGQGRRIAAGTAATAAAGDQQARQEKQQ